MLRAHRARVRGTGATHAAAAQQERQPAPAAVHHEKPLAGPLRRDSLCPRTVLCRTGSRRVTHSELSHCTAHRSHTLQRRFVYQFPFVFVCAWPLFAQTSAPLWTMAGWISGLSNLINDIGGVGGIASALGCDVDFATAWTSGSSMITARRNHFAGSFGGVVYACGGYTPFSSRSRSCDIYDGSSWSVSSAMLQSADRYKCSNGVLFANRLVVCGGGGDASTESTCEAFDGSAWSIISGGMSIGRGSPPGIASYRGQLYICGSIRGTGSSSCDMYDGAQWSLLSLPDTFGSGPTVGGTTDEQLYMCVGSKCWASDGSSWLEVAAAVPTGVGWGTAASLPAGITICNGECFQLRGDAWSSLPTSASLPVNGDYQSAVQNNALLITGGSIVQGSSRWYPSTSVRRLDFDYVRCQPSVSPPAPPLSSLLKLSATATLSSTWNIEFEVVYVASRCVDGDFSNLCHSKPESDPSLTLDLGTATQIVYVAVYNRNAG